MENEKKLKKIWWFLNGIYTVTLVYSMYHNLSIGNINGFNMCFVAILSVCAVPILFKVFHFKPVYEVFILSTVFAYIASLCGSTLGGYGIPFFDKFLHFSSGILMLCVSIMLYQLLLGRKVLKEEKQVFWVSVNAMNIAIALCWEFFEYSMLVFFNNDCINHYTTGVHDTITDMLCATVAGILLTIYMILHKENFFQRTIDKFYDRNIKHKKDLG